MGFVRKKLLQHHIGCAFSREISETWLLLQSGSERDPAQHPSLDGDAQLAVVEAVHASQAAADAGQGRGRDAQDGRGLRVHQEGAG